jgi:predicted DsbA family dithiol-disulfide isomerase
VPATFSVQYHPYLLNPGLNEDGPVERDAYYVGKFGREKWEGLKALIERRAREEGLGL